MFTFTFPQNKLQSKSPEQTRNNQRTLVAQLKKTIDFEHWSVTVRRLTLLEIHNK